MNDGSTLLEPGRNCWRIVSANRATVIVDADDYFRAIRATMLKAKRQILLIGWDFDARIRFKTDEEDDGPETIGAFSSWLVRRTPGLQVHILRWDKGALKRIFHDATTILEGPVAAALTAMQITDEDVAELERLLDEMESANARSAGAGELVDRRFHETIARATRNSALASTVEQLWTIRNRSPQCVLLFEKTRAKGYVPVINEHRAILAALKARDANAARAAMRDHLSRVLNYLLDATEVEVIEEAKRRVAAQRDRFSADSRT